MMKLRLREVKQLTKAHIARKSQSLDLNSDLTSDSFLLINILYCFSSELMSECVGRRIGVPSSVFIKCRKFSWYPSLLGEV